MRTCCTTKKVWLQDRQADAGQSDAFVPLCLAGDTKITFLVWFIVLSTNIQWNAIACMSSDYFDALRKHYFLYI